MSPEEPIAALIADRLARRRHAKPLVLGLCAAQGSGKSTIAARLSGRFPRSAVLSLDDIYLTQSERRRLAREVHPLFETRGVPGTHDVGLGVETIAALSAGEPALLPRFDKAVDDRAPMAVWPRAPRDSELLIFEGWCVGAAPQDVEALAAPVNLLEANEDPDGVWRCYVNAALGGAYRALFEKIDALTLMIPPNWPTVLRWRTEQEEALQHKAGGLGGAMDGPRLARFVSHYERLTRHIWSEMPARADLSVRLDASRSLDVSL
ncbi:kinase [Caulobacter radicis]|uniref:kinase n=1 Tax=Caulobacter radicis TaxID=2172650 RepID=UPI000D56F003|nr:kinase [Caulobacter radicis]PVM84494.1 kinase [Caulobacter radicis]